MEVTTNKESHELSPISCYKGLETNGTSVNIAQEKVADKLLVSKVENRYRSFDLWVYRF